jgi:peptidoglycan DL-endopeptidase CwlO
VTAVPPGTPATLAGLSGPPPAHQEAVARPPLVLKVILAALAAALMVLVLTPLTPAPASAAATPKRLIALQWAESQAGKWYCFGGAGPSCFDCSGLVMTAYAQAGITLPRTTYGMLASSKLVPIPASQRKRGDLAFYGSGHVELVTRTGTFGAAAPGTQVGWHIPSLWWSPTMYFRVR